MVNGQICDLVFFSQCLGGVVTCGLLGKSTFVLDKLSSRVRAPGGVPPDPRCPGGPSALLPSLHIVCGQQLQQGWLPECGGGGGIRSGTGMSEWREGNHLLSTTAAESMKNQVVTGGPIARDVWEAQGPRN